MKWSKQAWAAIPSVYDEILNLPFIRELITGSLDKEKFAFYIQQDALYLSDFGKILTGLATRLSKPEHIEAFIGFAGETMVVERVLHQQFCETLCVAAATQPSPSCLLYTSFLYRQFNAPAEVMAAAVLPCFWIYKEVGDYILANCNPNNNPYQAWINTYGGEEFARSVEKAIRICDELADNCTVDQQKAMTDAFILCSKMEWMFWDSAYRIEQWRI